MSVKLKRILTILIISLPLLYYAYLLFSKGFENSYFFFLYNSLVIFSLPFLASRYVSSYNALKIPGAFFFLLYPLIYLIAYIFAKILPVELSTILYIISILAVLKWNFFLFLFIWNLKWSVIRKFFLENTYLLAVFGIYSVIFLFMRTVDTIISLDYLQHLTVSEKMKIGEQLCLTPNQCSELFLKVGYTTIYHSILGFLTAFSNENPLRSLFFLDLAYPLLIATLAFNLLKKFSKNLIIVALFSLATILIYVNGTYETTLFLPQTLAFVFFLSILLQKKTDVKVLIASGVLLILTHFVMGPFLFAFLLLKYFVIEKIDVKLLASFQKPIFFFSLFTPLLFLLVSSSGFSIEKYFQESDIAVIGGVTNMPFPENLWIYLSIWGGVGMFLLFSILFQKNKKKPWYIYSLIYLSITLCLYLLAPTYANKFLMGISIFSIILIVKYLENLRDNTIRVLVAMILVLFLIPGFYFRYLSSLDFYRQRDNIATVVPERNTYLLKHLRNLDHIDCVFVSDPLTQIQIEGLGLKNTAKAQYILPESRKSIFEFSKEPTDKNYEKLLEIEELNGREMCFVYSSIIHTSIHRDDTNWLFHMFSLPKDDSAPVQETDVKYFMLGKGYKVSYQDPQFIVFMKD